MGESTDLYRAWAADGTLLYVGMSFHSLSRLCQHRLNAVWFDQVETIKIERFESRGRAIIAEANAIRIERPKHNVVHNEAKPRRRRTPLIARSSFPNEENMFTREQLAGHLGVKYSDLMQFSRKSKFPQFCYLDPAGRRYWKLRTVKRWLTLAGIIEPAAPARRGRLARNSASLPP